MVEAVTSKQQTTNSYDSCAEIILKRTNGVQPIMGIVLGSGQTAFADELDQCIAIPYSDLPGFPNITCHGQSGTLFFGYIQKKPVICLQGRSHYYEGAGDSGMKQYVRTLKALGCQYFIATNASGSLRKEVGPGELVMVTDHINFQGRNPLVGENDSSHGPRFLALDNLYNDGLRERFAESAKAIGLTLHEGVYISVLGPVYETPAEIRAFKLLGADLVGMSTVPEVILAHHCGLKVAVISTITNLATGLADQSHDHNEVVAKANDAAHKLRQLFAHAISGLE